MFIYICTLYIVLINDSGKNISRYKKQDNFDTFRILYPDIDISETNVSFICIKDTCICDRAQHDTRNVYSYVSFKKHFRQHVLSPSYHSNFFANT